MRILYGVQGTGNGHIARARVMAKAFAMRDNVEIDFVFSGRDPSKYFDMEIFGNYRALQGLTFIAENGAVNKWKTIKCVGVRQFIKDIRNLEVDSYDLLINDFEPLTAWAAKTGGLASISVSHQAAFCHAIPKQDETLFDRILMKVFAPCDINLGVHWYHFGFPILPPFIEERFENATTGKDILVYLPFENVDSITKMLKQFTTQSFICYHPEVETDSDDGHTIWRSPSKAKFQQALFECAGVIANGGFELSSECLQLGKKLLIKPLHGQYEQSSNRVTLEKMERCLSMDSLDASVIEQWLKLDSPEPIFYPHSPITFIDWILEENWDSTQPLVDKLWLEAKLPPSVQSALANS